MTGFGPFVPPTHDMNAWKSLKTFDCRRSQGMPLEIYTALSKLPRLHCLYFYLIQRKDTPTQNRSSETLDLDIEPTFPSLRHLTLISEEIENCTEVLRNNSYPVLSTLSVGLDFRSGPNSIHSGSLGLDLLDIIPRRVSSNLRQLLIEGYRCDPPVPNPHYHNSSQMLHVIRSMLQAFPNMERFELQDCQFTFDVDRTFLMEIGTAWPRLEALALNPDFSTIWPSTNLLSLPDVLDFSQQLPSLSCLWIRVDANGCQLNIANTTYPGASSELQQQHLGDSPINNPDDVVEFLLRSFPKLQYLEAWKYSTPSHGLEERRYMKQWRIVQKKVNKMQKPPTKAWF
ncbi:hypothetical protein C8Q75DRAFT_180509 [Abortiporus biennis]|nr:hypothetical protein C8Q75DRAFT_180509 [Abortiporus biennis]